MNRQFSAQEMEQCGFISRILPVEGFREHVLKLAADTAKFSLDAMKTTKKLVRDIDREMLLRVNEEEIDRLAERMASPESIESILKFVGTYISLACRCRCAFIILIPLRLQRMLRRRSSSKSCKSRLNYRLSLPVLTIN